MGTRFYLEVVKMFWTRQSGGWTHIVNVLNDTELFTLKWLVLCYVNCTQLKEALCFLSHLAYLEHYYHSRRNDVGPAFRIEFLLCTNPSDGF